MQKWLDASSSSNRYQQMYIKGFLDISGGNLILRNNNLHVLTGDASFGNNVYINGNTFIKSKLVVQDLSINGNSTIKFQDNSIPATAIIGGIPASTGIFNVDASFNSKIYVNGNAMFHSDTTFNNRIYVSQIYENGNALSSIYAPINSPTFTGGATFTGSVSGLNASMVGLGNVQNTSDMDKPVSTATTSAIAGKASTTDASFVGVPRAPTATLGTNTNQIATTEFVNSQIGVVVANPPVTMNTLQSLASAMNNDPSFGTNLVTTVNTSLFNKAPIDRPSFLNYVYIPKLFLTSDASFAGKLFVAGDVSMNGNIKAKAVYEGGNSLITKYATLAAPIFTGKVVSTNDVSINSMLLVNNDITTNGRLFVANDASFGGRLTIGKTMNVLGDVSLNGRFLVSNDVSLNMSLTVTGNTNIGGNLMVGNTLLVTNNNVTVNNQTTFGTDASFNNNVDISGTIIAHNNMNLYGVITQQGVNLYDGNYTTFDSIVITDVSSIKNLVNIKTGSTNTILGNNAGTTSGTNVTVIGNNASPSTANVSNEITLGNSSVTVLRCAATAITSVSDKRDKTNIEGLDAGLNFISELKPVKFEWAMRDGGKVGELDYGFIAQDLLDAERNTNVVVPHLVNTVNPERYEACYSKLLPVMVKAIQELQDTINDLRAEMDTMKLLR